MGAFYGLLRAKLVPQSEISRTFPAGWATVTFGGTGEDRLHDRPFDGKCDDDPFVCDTSSLNSSGLDVSHPACTSPYYFWDPMGSFAGYQGWRCCSLQARTGHGDQAWPHLHA